MGRAVRPGPFAQERAVVLFQQSRAGAAQSEPSAFAHSTVQRTCAPAILGDCKLIEHENYASLTNDMCPRFNLAADFATIEELAK
jgi:hypothetical protein